MWFFRRRRTKPIPPKYDIEAVDVRPKGVTRPLRQQRTPDVPASVMLGHARVERAVQQFLGAENWPDTHAVLVREQEYLISNDGIALVSEFVRQARHSGVAGGEQVAEYLEAHRLLLERVRALGVEPAWTEFQSQRLDSLGNGVRIPGLEADADTQIIAEALRRFLSTNSWGETHAVLVADQDLLLSEATEEFLSALIHVAQQSNDAAAMEGLYYLELHRRLLRDARQLGIMAAWENFETMRRQANDDRQPQMTNARSSHEAHLNAVTNAIKTLLTTSTWDETRQVLEQEQELLLTDTCERLLSELIDAAERDHEEHAARNLVYLKMHQRLLQIARREGITEAWMSFEEAMGLPLSAGGRRGSREAAYVEEDEPLSPVEISMRNIRDAVQAFLSAASWTAARTTLAAHQEELLTDLAVALISAQADQMQARGTERDLYATRLLNLQARLLRRAREIGIDAAWDEFELERN